MKKLLSILMLTLVSCTKASSLHSVRVITFAVDSTGVNYVQPSNTVMYLNETKVLCFPDSVYGYNTNPTFAMDGLNDGDEIRIVSFVNEGEPLQLKTIRVYVDNKVVYNVSNVKNINDVVRIKTP
jgi:hypothetical protein